MRTGLLPLRRNAPLTLAVAGFAVLTVQIQLGVGGAWLARFDERWTYNAVIALAALNCLLCARSRSDRIVWLAVGTAIASWGAGDVYYTFWLESKSVIPFPSLADAGYLLFYPPVYVALVVLFSKEVRGIVRSLWLDGIIAALTTAGLAASVVYEVVRRSLGGSDLSTTALATNLAYPLADMIVLGIVIGALALAGWRFSYRWLLFGGGLVLFALADSVYLVRTATDSYSYGTLLDLGWPAGMLLIAGAGTLPSKRVQAAQLEGYRLLFVPAVFGTIALGLEVYDHFRPLNAFGITLTSLALAAVILRMGMTFTDYLQLLERTRRESKTDSLTGLWNRRALVADLDSTITAATPSVLLLFDLNGFKSYNDRFGHPAGDALLARLGAQLETRVGSRGKAYRLGGDEFCVLVLGGPEVVAETVALTTAALTEEGEGFLITSSVGTVVLPDEAADTTEALKIVDRRMYRDKGSDRAVGVEGRGVLLGVLEARDPVLAEHTTEVVRIAKAIAENLTQDVSLDAVVTTAQLHDIGKVAIPDSILLKPGALDPSDWEVVRQHTIAGERIVGRVAGLEAIADAVRASHERWDGAGYPDGLAGESIPLVARIVTVADAYAAMTSVDRPYREPLSYEEAEAEIVRCAGTQFDPSVVQALVAALAAERAARAAAVVAA
ncbi:MAG: bifunctional diguanylate cyclase/phosphohydrolase [Gaiellaceae bacterium]